MAWRSGSTGAATSVSRLLLEERMEMHGAKSSVSFLLSMQRVLFRLYKQMTCARDVIPLAVRAAVRSVGLPEDNSRVAGLANVSTAASNFDADVSGNLD